MGKHTPGPWIVRTFRDDCFVQGDNVIGHTIAGAYKREILSDEEYPEKLADARLIAAAPELLQCLSELYAMVKGECPSLLNEDSGGCARLDMAILKAFAKTEGRE